MAARGLRPVGPALALLVALSGLTCSPPGWAGPLLERWRERHAALQLEDPADDVRSASPVPLPAGARLLRDVTYGSDPAQCMDVYLPAPAPIGSTRAAAPVILMVHGGGWRHGDKTNARVVENKVKRWVARGWVLVSVNYRLQQSVNPVQQAGDVAMALAAAQARATAWGADPARFILMGHSAGAHLVALLSSAPQQALAAGAQPWLGTVVLDSAALEVPHIMTARHLGLYDRAFGQDAALWVRASPSHQLARDARPMLLVCSSRRDDACEQARLFAGRAAALGVRAEPLPQALSHGEINADLGLPGAYTDAVEAFMGSLDAAVKAALR